MPLTSPLPVRNGVEVTLIRPRGDGLVALDLAGGESLICHPASMTHAAMPPEVQAAAGITDGMLRVAVGIEQIDDLVADLRAGLDRAMRV